LLLVTSEGTITEEASETTECGVRTGATVDAVVFQKLRSRHKVGGLGVARFDPGEQSVGQGRVELFELVFEWVTHGIAIV
jgi:hypothetical protein